MAETTTTAVTTGSKAADRAVRAVAAASETLPTVVETAEVALTVPSKVVLNQRLIVVASIVGGTVLGAGALYGYNKFQQARANKKLHAAVDEMTAPTDK